MRKVLAKKILVDLVSSSDVLGKSTALTIANTLAMHGGKMVSLIANDEQTRLRIQSNEVTYTIIKEALEGLETEEIIEKNVRVLIIK